MVPEPRVTPVAVAQPSLARAELSPRQVLRLQRSAGNRAVRRVLARYQIEGPWDVNDPVHEVLTLTAMKTAIDLLNGTPSSLLKSVNTSKFPALASKSGHNINPTDIDKSAQQFIRGVVWPDDPKGWLFDEESGTTNYSSGIKWNNEFDPKHKDDPSKLIGRSHYGDLQFFHGMASADSEAALDTKKKIMDWARFLIEVATGRIDSNKQLKDIPYTKDLFAAFADKTVKQLFVFAKATDMDARQRAAGALMHLVQDSHAKGHVQRDDKTGEILQFHSYEQQDHDKHGHDDAWAKGKTLQDRINATPGAASAIEKCAAVLVMLDQGETTDDIVKFLDEQVFNLASGVTASGPGKEFKK